MSGPCSQIQSVSLAVHAGGQVQRMLPRGVCRGTWNSAPPLLPMLIGVLPTGPLPAQARESPVTQGSALAPTRLPGLPDWPRHFHSLPANHPWLFTRSIVRRPCPCMLLCLPAPQPTPGHLSCPSVCLFFWLLHKMWDLSSSTRDQICVPCIGSSKS